MAESGVSNTRLYLGKSESNLLAHCLIGAALRRADTRTRACILSALAPLL